MYSAVGKDSVAAAACCWSLHQPTKAISTSRSAATSTTAAVCLSHMGEEKTTLVVRESLPVPAADIGPYVANASYPLHSPYPPDVEATQGSPGLRVKPVA
jgi:hypothetical protein